MNEQLFFIKILNSVYQIAKELNNNEIIKMDEFIVKLKALDDSERDRILKEIEQSEEIVEEEILECPICNKGEKDCICSWNEQSKYLGIE